MNARKQTLLHRYASKKIRADYILMCFDLKLLSFPRHFIKVISVSPANRAPLSSRVLRSIRVRLEFIVQCEADKILISFISKTQIMAFYLINSRWLLHRLHIWPFYSSLNRNEWAFLLYIAPFIVFINCSSLIVHMESIIITSFYVCSAQLF